MTERGLIRILEFCSIEKITTPVPDPCPLTFNHSVYCESCWDYEAFKLSDLEMRELRQWAARGY